MNDGKQHATPNPAARLMSDGPKPERMSVKETLIFYAKLAGFLAGLALFGFIVFYLRRQL